MLLIIHPIRGALCAVHCHLWVARGHLFHMLRPDGMAGCNAEIAYNQQLSPYYTIPGYL